jgi:ABC-type transporter MlaC component
VNLKLIVTILVIATAPICAQAQKPTPPKVTKADAQKVLKIISRDKAKTRIYCEMAKLSAQMEQANETGDSKKFDKLFQRIYELSKKLGSEYAALIEGLQDIDPESEVGQEISSTMDALDNLCGG